MTDEQITNSLNHLAEQKYLRVASRSVCKHAAERIEQLVAINEELEAKLAKAVNGVHRHTWNPPTNFGSKEE